MSAPTWDWRELDAVCSKIGSGATPRGGESVYLDVGTPIIRSKNVYNGRFAYDGLAFIDDSAAEKLRNVSVERGDILLNITGDSVARSCLVPSDVLPARVNQHVAIIRPRREAADSRFLGYFLITPFMQKTMLSWAGAGGTRKAMTKEMIEGFRVPLPSLAVQAKTADVLSAYDDLIENNRRRIALLEEAARLLYREWFIHLRFPGHEHAKFIDGLPEGWQRASASQAFEVNPKTPKRDEPTIRYVPMAALSETGMLIDRATTEVREAASGARFQNGDTLLARITPCLENGKTGFVQLLDDAEVACGSTEFIVLRGALVSNYFVYLASRQEDFRENAIHSMIGSSGRQRVQASCFDRYMIAVPPGNLAALFDESVRPMFEQIGNLDQQNQKLAQARDLLLPRLMSGELAV